MAVLWGSGSHDLPALSCFMACRNKIPIYHIRTARKGKIWEKKPLLLKSLAKVAKSDERRDRLAGRQSSPAMTASHLSPRRHSLHV